MNNQLYHQLALDFSLSRSDFPLTENRFVEKSYLEGRRRYKSDDCLLQVLSVDSHLVMASTDRELLNWCREEFREAEGEWFGEPREIERLGAKLREMGHRIASAHPFFIPGKLTEPDPDFSVCWYDRETLEVFRDDPRFSNVLGDGDPLRPDMLAVAAILEGQIMGAAGASADSPRAWQIGVDVLPAFRGRGIATALTALLAREIQSRGLLPFYGTGSSHILSQRVAIGAGFVPGWWELYTKPIE